MKAERTKLLQSRRWLAPLAAWLALAFPPAPGRAIETDIRRDAVVVATELVQPSVVNIATTKVVEYRDFYQDWFLRFYGQRAPAQQREELNSVGSGVIIDEDGYVLTNFHVLRRASRVQVKLWDGRVYDADPLVYTPLKDVAMLKIRAKPGEKFKAIKLAKDDDLLLGETVLALGNPYGLGGSVTRGILSSKNRRPASGNEPLSVEDWLQTDADINPGNSGGPLVNLRGELIGINVAVFREEQGMGVGFAIPVKHVSSALAEFFTPEVAYATWFGARFHGGPDPLLITSIQRDSPADKAGLRVGQHITRVNGEAARSLPDFGRLAMTNPDHTATLEVEENNQRHTVHVQFIPFQDLMRQRLGLVVSVLTQQDIADFQINPGEGLMIKEVEKKSPADKAQLQPGMLLTAIDGRNVGDLIGFCDALSQKKSGDRVALSVLLRRVQGELVQYRHATANLVLR